MVGSERGSWVRGAIFYFLVFYDGGTVGKWGENGGGGN